MVPRADRASTQVEHFVHHDRIEEQGGPWQASENEVRKLS
jgi:hypothetical protein